MKGTLFSLDTVLAALSRIIENDTGQRQARRFLRAWMTAATRDYMATSHAGEYRTLEHVLEMTLPRTCALEGFPMPTTAATHDIMASFQELQPRPNAVETIQSLYRAGWDLWILTSGSYDDARELLAHHGLLEYFCLPNQDQANIYGCDELRISRPHPKVYSELMRLNVRRTRRIEVSRMENEKVGRHPDYRLVCVLPEFLFRFDARMGHCWGEKPLVPHHLFIQRRNVIPLRSVRTQPRRGPHRPPRRHASHGGHRIPPRGHQIPTLLSTYRGR